ncbi:hypothetical protein KKD61_01340 [Patescibacteria group bacterium]|nr:hypothetical protein [Patescibacteria group bacterium]
MVETTSVRQGMVTLLGFRCLREEVAAQRAMLPLSRVATIGWRRAPEEAGEKTSKVWVRVQIYAPTGDEIEALLEGAKRRCAQRLVRGASRVYRG